MLYNKKSFIASTFPTALWFQTALCVLVFLCHRHESIILSLTLFHHFGVGPFWAWVIVTESITKYSKPVAFNHSDVFLL